MKKTLALALGLSTVLTSFSALAADKLTLQLKWVTQAQFDGYYVAKAKGYYEKEGLDVTLKPGGPDIAPEQVIAGGGADVIVDWAAAALSAREKGLPLVNIAQPFKKAGLMLTCLKSSGITKPAEFKGKTLGVWFYGNELPFFAWMKKLGLPTDGGKDGVKVLKQAFNVDPLLQKQAECISTMNYNEYNQVLEAGIKAKDLVVFKYEDVGVSLLEDGLYTTETALKDPAMVAKLAKFVKASMKGFDYAAAHPDEAAKIIIDADESGAQKLSHQVSMAKEVGKLTAGSTGALDKTAFDRTVSILKDAGVLTKDPVGAYTTVVTDAAK